MVEQSVLIREARNFVAALEEGGVEFTVQHIAPITVVTVGGVELWFTDGRLYAASPVEK